MCTTYLDTSVVEIDPSATVYHKRKAFYTLYEQPGIPQVSIAVIGYNQLAKTRYCVESILAHTMDIDYELILIDCASDDETLVFFESVTHPNKQVIRLTKNLGLPFALLTARRVYTGAYLCQVSNDVYVTHNWLHNLLAAYESSPQIGLVAPMSNNVSNLQWVNLPASNLTEMQQQAAVFNQPDPTKWEQRDRLITILILMHRSVVDHVGAFDLGFEHNYADDDLSARLRRAGYHLVLCKDTYVHHDDDFSTKTGHPSYQASLLAGERLFYQLHKVPPQFIVDPMPLRTQLIKRAISNPREILVINPGSGLGLKEMGQLFPQAVVNAYVTDPAYHVDAKSFAKRLYHRGKPIDRVFDLVVLGMPQSGFPEVPVYVIGGGVMVFTLQDSGQLAQIPDFYQDSDAGAVDMEQDPYTGHCHISIKLR